MFPLGFSGSTLNALIFFLFPFSFFGREYLVDPNSLVNFGATCIVNVSISPFR